MPASASLGFTHSINTVRRNRPKSWEERLTGRLGDTGHGFRWNSLPGVHSSRVAARVQSRSVHTPSGPLCLLRVRCGVGEPTPTLTCPGTLFCSNKSPSACSSVPFAHLLLVPTFPVFFRVQKKGRWNVLACGTAAERGGSRPPAWYETWGSQGCSALGNLSAFTAPNNQDRPGRSPRSRHISVNDRQGTSGTEGKGQPSTD